MQHVDINKNKKDRTARTGDTVRGIGSKEDQQKIISSQDGKYDYSDKTESLTDREELGKKSTSASSQAPSLKTEPCTLTTSTVTVSSSSSLPVMVSSPASTHPSHFKRGSIIQLADGSLKPVEDLITEDFIQSARANQDVFLDKSTLVKIETEENSEEIGLTFSVGKDKLMVRVRAPSEHPFFVYGRSWSSVSPRGSRERYGLQCDLLTPGDVCISLTQHQLASRAQH